MKKRGKAKVTADLEKAKGGTPKADDEENGEEEEEDEGAGEDMEKKKGAKKAQDLTGDDLEKSLDQLTAIVSAGDTTTRKQVLLEKAQEGVLEKSERDELFQLLGGPEPSATPALSEAVVKSMGQNENLQKALDVSEYLEEQHAELQKSLVVLSDHVESSDKRQHEYNLVLAKAVANIGTLVKSMSEQLEAFGGQPVRTPKSRGASAQTLNKSFANQPGEGEQLSKSQICDGFEGMMEKSMQEGRKGKAQGGWDIPTAMSKYEQFNQIHPQVLSEVQGHLKGAAH